MPAEKTFYLGRTDTKAVCPEGAACLVLFDISDLEGTPETLLGHFRTCFLSFDSCILFGNLREETQNIPLPSGLTGTESSSGWWDLVVQIDPGACLNWQIIPIVYGRISPETMENLVRDLYGEEQTVSYAISSPDSDWSIGEDDADPYALGRLAEEDAFHLLEQFVQ